MAGSPAIFSGLFSKLLTSRGIQRSDGALIEHDGIPNFITNGHAEVNTTGWATYADAAGTSPVDGTGGSANVTWTRSTSSPLSGAGSFLFTKDANDRQGQGVSYAFSIDSSAQTKVLQLSFDYEIVSGSFTAGTSTAASDLTVWIYDVTNGTLIQPSTHKLFAASGKDRFIANFQTSSNSTSYRLIIHCGSATIAGFVLKFDNIKVQPTQYSYGTVITDWSDGTTTYSSLLGATTTAPTLGNATVSVNRVFHRRVGGNLHVRFEFRYTAAGTSSAGSGDYLFTLPGSLSMDTTKISTYSTVEGWNSSFLASSAVGSALFGNNTNQAFGIVVPYSATQVRFFAEDGASNTQGAISSTGYQFSSTQLFHVGEFEVPIAGWSSTTQMSDVSDQRIVAAKYTLADGVSTNTTTPLNAATKVYDTHNAVTTGAAWKFTAPIAGIYEITTSFYTGLTTYEYAIYKNGTADTYLGTSGTGIICAATAQISLNAGDYIDVRNTTGTSSTTASSGLGSKFIAIKRLANPAQISATETIAASYYCSAGFAANTTTPINFDTKELDTHGAVTTSATAFKFTAPATGTYRLGAFLLSSGTTVTYRLYKNGTFYKAIGYSGSSAAGTPSTIISLVAGDYIDIRPSGAATIQGGSLGGDSTSNFNIQRIGL
jgi:hypothetical protein